jgi:hypothetical protein
MKKIMYYKNYFLPVIVLSMATIFIITMNFYMPAKADNKASASIKASHNVPLETIDDLVKYSNYIVLGTVESESDFNDSTSEYKFLVENNLKSSIKAPEIYVYEAKAALISGNRYLLYLSCSDSIYYPGGAIYTSIDKESITLIDDNNLTSSNKFTDKEMNESKLINKIRSSEFINSKKEQRYDFMDKAEDYTELSDMSDYVIQVIPKKVLFENKYIKLIEPEIIKSYKGTLDNPKNLILPSNVEVGNEYLIYMKKYDGELALTTKNGSIIKKDDIESWNKALDKINK